MLTACGGTEVGQPPSYAGDSTPGDGRTTDEAPTPDAEMTGDSETYRPPSIPAGDGCGGAPVLDLGSGPVLVMTVVPLDANGAASACGLAESADGYFSVTLEERSRVAVSASGTAPVAVGLFPNICPPTAALGPCAASTIVDLDPGTYLLGVMGDLGTDLTLSVAATPIGPPSADWPPVIEGNDACASAVPLDVAGASVALAGTLATASDDGLGVACAGTAGDPDVFYSVTVPAKGRLTATVFSDTDVWVGWLAQGCPPGPAPIPCGAAASLAVAAGTYILGVTGATDAAFDLTVVWQEDPPVPGSCAAPIPITLVGGTATISASFTGAPSEQAGSCRSATQSERAYELVLTAAADLQLASYDWVTVYLRRGPCASGTEVECATLLSDSLYLWNLQAGTYSLFVEYYADNPAEVHIQVTSPPATPPANDACVDAETLTFVGDVATATASFVAAAADGAGTSCGGPSHLYYQVTLDSPAELQIAVDDYYVGALLSRGTCGGLTSIFCDYAGVSFCSGALAAGTYFIRLGEYWEPVLAPVTLTVTRLPAVMAPTNDTCDGAQTIDVASGTASVSGTLLGAANDVSFGGSCYVSSGAGQDVFYSLPLAVKSDVTLSLGGSAAYDMTTWLLSGTCGSTTVVGCGSSTTARRYESLAAGTYLIGVEWDYLYSSSCRSATTDSFTLQVQATPTPAPPANDACVAPTDVSLPAVGSVTAVAGSTRGATNDFGQILCPGASGTTSVSGRDVVYAVTTGVAGVLRITPVTSFSGMMLYLVTPCGDDAAWACKANGTLSTGFAIPTGTYYLIVDQTSGFAGDFSLFLELAAP